MLTCLIIKELAKQIIISMDFMGGMALEWMKHMCCVDHLFYPVLQDTIQMVLGLMH
jgi:hypothetical protein